ncbi:MAG: sigma-70 family polymerase sigma factor [Conexibacter sp.]|nr:sigma-70 family polymerase sigma factor [Conexibacter sp.]
MTTPALPSPSAAKSKARAPRAGSATDEALVAAIRAGSDAAFTAVVHRYEQQLTAYARQILGGRHHDAEECVQDAFVRALRSMRAGDADIALRPWLHAIVRNRCLDQLRKPDRTTDLDPHEGVLADLGPGPVSTIARRQRLDEVVGGVEALAVGDHRHRAGAVVGDDGLVGLEVGGAVGLAQLVEAAVADDRVQPRAQRDLGVAVGDGAQRPDEGVLHALLGVVVVAAEHLAGVGRQRRLVAADDGGEGGIRACTDGGDERLVGRRAGAWRARLGGGGGDRVHAHHGRRAGPLAPATPGLRLPHPR